MRTLNIEDRFLEKCCFSASTGCWIWQAFARGRHGKLYGVFRGGGGSPVLAHRWAYEHFVGPIAPGLQFRHARECPSLCVNPFHCREPGTGSENLQDAVGDGTHPQARKTHCPQGHAYTAENTYVTPAGSRRCRVCGREASTRWKRSVR